MLLHLKPTELTVNAGIRMEQMQERLDSISTKLVTLSSTTNSLSISIITKPVNASKAELKISNMELKKDVQLQDKKLDFIFKDAPLIRSKN